MQTVQPPFERIALLREPYFRLTRTASYSFLAILPLLILYELLIIFANVGRAMSIRVGADVWIKQMLAALGVQGHLILGGIVVLIGIGIFFYERKKDIPIRPRYFGWMLLESVLFAVVLAAIVSATIGFIFFGVPVSSPVLLQADIFQNGQNFWLLLALSLGAGLYEELVFRVLLVGGLYWLLKHFMAERTAAYLIAAIVGALVFSAVHYTGALGDPFTLPSFTFRFLFGLALNALYLVRGFGIAAWTHALYDVMIVTRVLG